MKKVNITFLLTMLISMVGLNASAKDYDIKVQNADGKTIYYNFINNKTELAVTYKGILPDSYSNEYTGNVVIPKYVTYNNKTYSVTSIEYDAFHGCSGLTSVTIPNSVTSIGSDAFHGCSGLTSIAIPNSVTSIGYNAFLSCSGLTSVTIPNSVTSIGGCAFSGCSKLTSVTINSDGILSEAYTPSSNLSNIFGAQVKQYIIGNSVTSIGERAFYGCSKLTSVTIPNSVTRIEYEAFSDCSGLTSITIPNSVTSIEMSAFLRCSGLKKVIVPDIAAWCGIKFGSMYANPLNYAHHLYSDKSTEITELVIPDGVTSIGNYAFYNCSGLTSIDIPYSVTSIGGGAFRGCSGLTSITIPNSVTSIGSEAFRGCSGLTSIAVENGNSIYDSREDCNAIIETSSNKLIQGCNNTVIPNSVTSIGDYAFNDCSGLPSITIPNSVKSIGERAFYGCSGLTSVTIPNNVTSIGWYAFSDCSGLTSVTIPNSVTSIGYKAFNGCSGLTLVESRIGKVFGIDDNTFSSETYNNAKLRVPRDLSSMYKQATGWKKFKSITEEGGQICGDNLTYTYSEASGKLTIQGTGAMYDYSSSSPAPWNSYKGDIITIVIEDGATSVGSYAFSDCSKLTSVTIPNSVTSIGEDAFNGCSGLTSVTINSDAILSKTYTSSSNLSNIFGAQVKQYIIGNSVTSIGKAAFSGCSGLTSVTIPNSVTSIGNGAFYRCSGLTSIEIPNSVTSIGIQAFQACSGLTSIEIPNSVTSIGTNTFLGCSGLTSVTIPNSVTSIGKQAFYGCSGLTSITIPNSVTSIGEDAFSDCSGLTSVTIPNSVTSIGDDAFSWCSGLTSVTIGTGVTSIESDAFYDCSKLASVTFHCNNVGTWFKGKSSIKEIWIEKEVTSIAQESFAGCSGLQSVYNNAEDAFAIAKNTFDDATYSSATLYVPTGMKATYEDTQWWLSFNKKEEYDFPTGITIPQQSKDVKVVDAYQINGLKTGSMQKGLNILKMSDGTTRKVVK